VLIGHGARHFNLYGSPPVTSHNVRQALIPKGTQEKFILDIFQSFQQGAEILLGLHACPVAYFYRTLPVIFAS
jgi:hypothetical protein